MTLNKDLRFLLHRILRDNNTNDIALLRLNSEFTAVILDISHLLRIKTQPKQELVVTL